MTAFPIAAEPADVVRLLDEEAAFGRVRRTDAGTWRLVVEAFAPDVVAALTAL